MSPVQAPLLVDAALPAQLTLVQRDILLQLIQRGRCSVLTFATTRHDAALQGLLEIGLLCCTKGGSEYHLTLLGVRVAALVEVSS